MADNLVDSAIEAVHNNVYAFCKFLSANDSGETGGHQAGVLIPVSVKMMFFNFSELDSHISKKTGRILWQDEYETNCTITWYSSKRELRITGFGRGRSPLKPELTGALFVMLKEEHNYYRGFIFNTDDDIRTFLDAFGLTPADTNNYIKSWANNPDAFERERIMAFIKNLSVEFPTTAEMSYAARQIERELFKDKNLSRMYPDIALVRWTELEYKLFCELENDRYNKDLSRGYLSVDEFIVTANKILNRRKSRAGKSLEHHLAALFDDNKIAYTAQGVTEGNKKPDFLFPSEEAYHDMSFSVNKLCTLAAKTTCKDRWRQILNEANRLRDCNKYLCTLQQGISAMQMDEMQAEKVVLIVPGKYISAYPRDRRDRIWTVEKFIKYVKEMEGIV